MSSSTRLPLALALAVAIVVILVIAFAGGGEQDAAPPQKPRSFLLAADYPNALSVLDAKSKKPGDEVAVYGRVFAITDGYAAFQIMDQELIYCGQESIEDDHCPTPWDYCCIQKETRIAASIPVEVRDAEGNPVEAKELKLRRLDMVAVKGKLEKTESGGLLLVINDGWFRRERPTLGKHVQWP